MIQRYQPGPERDACGIGFVADARGRASRMIVDSALEALCRVRHRGAVAADALTGDGAGVLLALPHHLLDPEERLGLAMVFADGDGADHRAIVERACLAEDLSVEGWRLVPTDRSALGEGAKATEPLIEQAIVARPAGVTLEEGERRAFRARRRIEAAARGSSIRLYVASLSFATVTYKALCAADQLSSYFHDLADESYESWFAIFHQRYSTNTTPSWERAQPFRFLGHNGEINTIRGNVASMQAREGRLGSVDLAPEELLSPVVDTRGSDSQIFDEALELLTRAGRDVRHACSMLMPAAPTDATDSDVKDFFDYHAALVEPWDGPAALVFTDGQRLGAALDRNGLRPLRVALCEDGLVAVSSEAGAIATRGHGRVRRSRIGPGQIFSVDPAEGGARFDADIKGELAKRRPYGDWIAEHLVEAGPGTPMEPPDADLTPRQVVAGYSKEEFTVVIRPMATQGQEPISSMGDDTAEAPLTSFHRNAFGHLKQRFAQVTNPPIDHLRERHVMSLQTRLGPRDRLLQERPEATRLRLYPTFLLFPDALEELEALGAAVIDATFPIEDGPAGLADGCTLLIDAAKKAVGSGAPFLIVSDRAVTSERAPIPAALAAGAVHHALLDAGLRTQTSLIVDSDEPRESHHAACLIANGADALCPRLVLGSIAQLAASGRLGSDVGGDEAQRLFMHAVEDGLLKIMSKMGISTLDSYRGAQIIEAMGLGPDVIEMGFPGVASTLGGVDLEMLAADVLDRHGRAFSGSARLAHPGNIKFKKGGEYHAFNNEVVDALHEVVGLKDADQATVEMTDEMAGAHALRSAARGDDSAYPRFARSVNERPPAEPRDLLDFVGRAEPIPLEEVEPALAITRRFSTGAMSHGALSAEAHETLAQAMTLIGGVANSGEGGEDEDRFLDSRNCGIKQIASGRFGVTPFYVASADELQIKMAQGSKPGEGGQLPGKKVSVEIARLRHTVPGVALISPPPHHDIYSIEDLSQLIYDLKQANPRATVSVKLVASEGVGTIAAGVVKGLADVVHLSGGDGGTGASPLTSIKNAGMPWELGLAETRDALVANGLRTRARIRVDGGLKTGRDIVLAALLGADEYSFGTAALVAEGCILVRTCHRDTCPVGIATQDPELRKKFEGTPEMVARYLTLVAEEARLLLAALGLRTMAEAIGRTDLLRQKVTGNERADSLSLAPLLAAPADDRSFSGTIPLQRPRSALGDRLYHDAFPALERGESVSLHYDITTSDRTVGARLGCSIRKELCLPKPEGKARVTFEGEAGQSFGAFLEEGIDFELVGEANDYVCKSMAGGRVVIKPPANDAGDPFLAGNTLLYGATGGQLFVAGRVGERFAVRNSGAVTVVEGTGDHACEYMTAGAVVILGPTGVNLGAGMSGGEAYIYDPEEHLATNLNKQLVDAYEPTSGQIESLKRVIALHVDATDSVLGRSIIERWDEASAHFKRVAPVAEVARLEALFEGTAGSSA